MRPTHVLQQLILLLFINCTGAPPKQERAPVASVPDTSAASSGDIVFRRGRDLIANMILAQRDSSSFSHVGLLLKTSQRIHVVHAISADVTDPGAVVVEPFADFFSPENASAGTIYRLSGLSAPQARQMISYALTRVGTPFDKDFSYTDNSSLYCTELVLKSIAAGGNSIRDEMRSVDILMIKEPVILPDHLMTDGHLTTVMDVIPVLK